MVGQDGLRPVQRSWVRGTWRGGRGGKGWEYAAGVAGVDPMSGRGILVWSVCLLLQYL
jgi:hypothetical protein